MVVSQIHSAIVGCGFARIENEGTYCVWRRWEYW